MKGMSNIINLVLCLLGHNTERVSFDVEDSNIVIVMLINKMSQIRIILDQYLSVRSTQNI